MTIVFRSDGSPVTNTQMDSNISQLNSGTVIQGSFTGDLDITNDLKVGGIGSAGTVQRNVTKHDISTGTGSPIYITLSGIHLINIPSNCYRQIQLSMNTIDGANALVRIKADGSSGSSNLAAGVYIYDTYSYGYIYGGSGNYPRGNWSTGNQILNKVPIPWVNNDTAVWIYFYQHNRPYGKNYYHHVIGYEKVT